MRAGLGQPSHHVVFSDGATPEGHYIACNRCETLGRRTAEGVEAMRPAAKNVRSESDSWRAVSRHDSEPTNLNSLIRFFTLAVLLTVVATAGERRPGANALSNRYCRFL